MFSGEVKGIAYTLQIPLCSGKLKVIGYNIVGEGIDGCRDVINGGGFKL